MQTQLGSDSKFRVRVLGSVKSGSIEVKPNGKTEPDVYDIIDALDGALR